MENQDIHNEFIAESIESLQAFEIHLLQLERGEPNQELLAALFRCMHSIKGSAGFLGFSRLEVLAHACENTLGALRDGRLRPDTPLVNKLLSARDSLRSMLEHAAATGQEPELDVSRQAAALNAILEDNHIEQSDTPELNNGDDFVLCDERKNESTVRVDVGLLDKMMNLVGELVLARNQISQLTDRKRESILAGATQRLSLITSELQEGVMKTRMQPVNIIWSSLPRIVRDVSMECGREISLDMHGGETELDRTLLEAIRDPIVHLLRNAIDHGIEDPQKRIELGKKRSGNICLRAFHEGGHVIIDLSDDGRGVNTTEVRQRAVEKALITPEAAERMGEREIYELLFRAGFSTANHVSRISGRGVGLDVVRSNIQRIGGAVDIESQIGVGTTFRIKIPLTLAIIPALIVSSGNDRYAIPQVNLLELVRINSQSATHVIEYIHETPVYRLRGSLLPLIDLKRELGDLADQAETAPPQFIVVVQADDRPFGILVDEVNDTEEIVVKPLGRLLQGITVFAGASILGDGRVALIIDAAGIANRANVLASVIKENNISKQSANNTNGQLVTLLLFTVAGHGSCALTLSDVARLEEIPSALIERVGSRCVVQYRGGIMPLVHVSESLGDDAEVATEALQVVVMEHKGQRIGLVVDNIHDIIEESISIERHTDVPGVIGWAIVKGKVTRLLDGQAILSRYVYDHVLSASEA